MICERCGHSMVPMQNISSPHGKRFCSDRCRIGWHNQRNNPKRAQRRADEIERLFQAWKTRLRYERMRGPHVIQGARQP